MLSADWWGCIGIKIGIIGSIAPFFGLSKCANYLPCEALLLQPYRCIPRPRQRPERGCPVERPCSSAPLIHLQRP